MNTMCLANVNTAWPCDQSPPRVSKNDVPVELYYLNKHIDSVLGVELVGLLIVSRLMHDNSSSL